MNTLLEGSKVTYHGRNPLGGWNYTRTELGVATVRGDLSLDDAELAARRLWPSATWFRAYEVLDDGSKHWFGSGSL
jgi:hypothetical protein